MRVNLVRNSFVRLRNLRAGGLSPLGEYTSDAVGNCETLVATGDGTRRNLSADALMATPVDPRSALGRKFDARFAPMAEQCAVARLEQPVVCCGEPRHCGRHECGASFAESHWRFWEAGQAAKDRAAVGATRYPVRSRRSLAG